MKALRRGLVILVAVAMGVSITALPANQAHGASSSEHVKIHMINVGGGDSILVEYEGHYALIDGGLGSNSGKYKNGKAVSGDCRLDKYKTLSKALRHDKSVNLDKFYFQRNLLSFYEHFDNDMKQLTGSTSASEIISRSESYVAAFNSAVAERQQYDEEMKRYPDWARYDKELAEYNEKLQDWEEYDEALMAYEQEVASYEDRLAVYQRELEEWQGRHPDGQEDPEDPMPVEPEEPGEPPMEPEFPRPEESDRPESPEGERPSFQNKSGLDDVAWESYQKNQAVFDGIKDLVTGKNTALLTRSSDAAFRKFVELQNLSQISNRKNKVLSRYYAALGYRYVYDLADSYLRSPEYTSGNYNDCLIYLQKHKIKTIDYMILTHAHKDHVGGLAAVLASDNITVKNIYWNGSSYGTGTFRLFEHEMMARKKAGKTKVFKADDNKNNTFVLGGKVKFTQLGDTDNKKWFPAYTKEPNQSSAKEKRKMNHIVNNQSLVYRMEFNGTSVLFTGDAEWKKDAWGNNRQKNILKKHRPKVNVDVYKASHHCHNNASSAVFNKAMSPVFVLTSCGRSSEPHKKARTALKGADHWITSKRGDEITAVIGKNTFRVLDGSKKDITKTPNYKHANVVSVTSNYGTPNASKASFRTGGRKVSGLRGKDDKLSFCNLPAGKKIKVKASGGWHYSKVQYQLSSGDKGFKDSRWKKGGTAILKGNFRGTVYFRFSNRFGQKAVCKTDLFETRTKTSSAKSGKAHLTGAQSATVDWYPVKGARKYKVWVKKGNKWKGLGTTRQLFMNAKGLPPGTQVTFRIKPVKGRGIATVRINTLKKLAAPAVAGEEETVRVTWKPVTGSEGYQVAVGSSVKATVKGTNTVSLKVAKGKKLNYKVRAFAPGNGRRVYGPWSSSAAFVLK